MTETNVYRRIKALWVQQEGLCWICGYPMQAPTATYNHDPYVATLDHLEERNGKYRPAKAAHRKCNTFRHHYPVDHPCIQHHIRAVQYYFEKQKQPKETFNPLLNPDIMERLNSKQPMSEK